MTQREWEVYVQHVGCNIHVFATRCRTAAAGDERAAERYEALAAVATEPETQERYRKAARASLESAGQNVDALRRRMRGENPMSYLRSRPVEDTQHMRPRRRRVVMP